MYRKLDLERETVAFELWESGHRCALAHFPTASTTTMSRFRKDLLHLPLTYLTFQLIGGQVLRNLRSFTSR